MLRYIAWAGAALYGHAIIHAIPRLCRQWTTARNRLAVSLFIACLLVSAMAPVPAIRFWHVLHEHELALAVEQLIENQRTTDSYTSRWLDTDPHDPAALLLRARFLRDTGRSDEATPLYRKAASTLPANWEPVRAMIEREVDAATRGAPDAN